MAVNGIIGTWAGPDAPGTAYVLMHHSVGDIGDGQIASWGYPEGGMGAVSDAVPSARRGSSAPRSASNARVCTIAQTNGRVVRRRARRRRGALRADRRDRRCHPKITFLDQLDRRPSCPTSSSNDIEHWKTRSGTVKINLALVGAAGVHRRPRVRPERARRRDPDPGRRRLPGDGVPGGAVRQGGDAARSATRRSPRCSTRRSRPRART